MNLPINRVESRFSLHSSFDCHQQTIKMFKSKKPKWETIDYGENEEDDEDNEESSENEESDGSQKESNHHDSASSEEDSEDNDTQLSKKGDFVTYISTIINEEWTGELKKDMDMVKDTFYKYILGSQIAKTPFFKKFHKEYIQAQKQIKKQLSQDGVKKSTTEIDEAAFDETFTHSEARFEDVIHEVYRRRDIEEDEDEDDDEEEKFVNQLKTSSANKEISDHFLTNS